MSRQRIPIYNVVQPQSTKGIFRSNAQRLSICLAPLVNQRSLLFRVQTDLGDNERYEDLLAINSGYSLQPPESSSSLWAISASVISSAGETPTFNLAAEDISTANSVASAYSQESFAEPVQLSQEIEPILPRTRRAAVGIHADPRRYAMAFSPSMDWEKVANMSSPEEYSAFNPDVQFQSFVFPVDLLGDDPFHSNKLPLGFVNPRRISRAPPRNAEMDPSSSIQGDTSQSVAAAPGTPSSPSVAQTRKVLSPNAKTRQKKLGRVSQRAALSKPPSSAKTIGKMFSRLSLDPSRLKASRRYHTRRSIAASNGASHPEPPQLELPTLQFSPISISIPRPPTPPHASPQNDEEEASTSQHQSPAPQNDDAHMEYVPPTDRTDAMERIRKLRSEAPPSSIPGASSRKTPLRKTHRRHTSSPSFPQFNSRTPATPPPPLPSGSKFLAEFTVPPLPRKQRAGT